VRRILVVPLVARAVSACSGAERPDPGPDAVDVRIRQIFDMSEGAYFEGSYSYVRVESLVGDELVEERLPLDAKKLDELRFLSTRALRLDPGTYRLVSFQRPCDGSCDSLDPPTDSCSRRITVTRDRSVDVATTVRPGEGCTVEID
jgi:hypothetical protein